MENNNLNKNSEVNIINVNGHPTRIASTGVIKLKIKEGVEFPSLRVIELPDSFITQEVSRWRTYKLIILNQGKIDPLTEKSRMRELSLLDAWFYIFESELRFSRIPTIEKIFKWNERFKEGGKFYKDARPIVEGIEHPLAKMQKYAKRSRFYEWDKERKRLQETGETKQLKKLIEKGPDKIEKSQMIQSFRKAQGFLQEDLKLSEEQINQSFEDFVDLQIKIESMKAKRKCFNEMRAEIRKDYSEILKKRFPDQNEKNRYRQTIGRRLENVWLHMLDGIATNFAEKLKPYVSDNELRLFKLLNNLQEFWARRIPWYDLETGLINGYSTDKELNLIHRIALSKVYGIKKLGNCNFEKFLEEKISDYLETIGSYRPMTRNDEQNKKSGQEYKKHIGLRLDPLISPDKENSETFGNMMADKIDIHRDIELKELKEKLIKFSESLPPAQAKVVCLIVENDFEITEEEIAQEITSQICEYTQQAVSKFLKKTLPKKAQKFGFIKDDLSLLYEQPLYERYNFSKNPKVYRPKESLDSKELQKEVIQKSGPVKIIRKARS